MPGPSSLPPSIAESSGELFISASKVSIHQTIRLSRSRTRPPDLPTPGRRSNRSMLSRPCGIKRRTIYLSEQGFNSPDYSPKSLADQAAGLAYAWKKIEPLDAIEAMQYHNWIDNSGEGGLRIGLRKFPEESADPLGKKPIWYLYQKLETPEEGKASAFALPVIGIENWYNVPRSEEHTSELQSLRH